MRATLLAGVCVVGASLVTACGDGGRGRPSTHATVGVLASGCSLVDDFGTGVAVAADLVATAAHTVAGAAVVTVVDQAGAARVADVVGFEPRQDVAILRIAAPLPFASLGPARAGDAAVLATWRPDDGFDDVDVTVTRLLRVTIEDIYVEEVGEREALEIDADAVRGDSGAPVFALDGSVVGIVYAASREREGVAFALRSDEIEAVMAGVDGRPVDNGRCT